MEGFSLSLSFIVWLLITVFLLGFWFWTIYILLRQRRAWKFYAQKRKLRYSSDGFYQGVTMNGAIDGYKISIFTSEHSELDARSQRRLSAIEISLHSKLDTYGAVASGGMVHVVEAIDLHQEFKPDAKKWDDAYVIRTRDVGYMKKYLNDERVDKLLDLMAEDKVWVILLFLEDTGILRIDTPLPLDDPKRMDFLVKKMIDVANVLELKKGEDKDLLREISGSDEKQKTLDIDDDLLDDDIGFELED